MASFDANYDAANEEIDANDIGLDDELVANT
jgi:hypothetical protein